MKKAALFLFQLLFLFASAYLNAENFRVMEMHDALISTDGSKTVISCGINDGICIQIPEDRRFIQGLQIDLHIPKVIASYRDSVALSLWTDCEDGASEIDFRGNKVYLDTVLPRLSQTLQLELAGRMVRKDPYATVIPYAIQDKDSSAVLRFQLAMKGVPADLLDAVLEVEIKAILSNEGLFTLDFTYPEEESVLAPAEETDTEEECAPLLVYIDEMPFQEYTGIILPAGIHHLSVIAENYRNEVRTFTIEQAKETALTVDLKAVTPELWLVAPENAVIYLDDELVESRNEKQLITAGWHTVRFVLADYELTRTFEAVSGRTYNVSVNVSLDIFEE